MLKPISLLGVFFAYLIFIPGSRIPDTLFTSSSFTSMRLFVVREFDAGSIYQLTATDGVTLFMVSRTLWVSLYLFSYI